MTDLSDQLNKIKDDVKCDTEKAKQKYQEFKGYSTIGKLGVINRFWQKAKWYLIGILLFLVFVVYYNKQQFGNVSMGVILVLAFLFILVIIVFNDNKGIIGNSVAFAVDPLPPHLGLDGVSNQVRFVN